MAATAAAVGLALKPALGESQDLAALTLKQASGLLRRKTASPVELTQACLKRIERYNPALNAFITVTSEQALETAREMQTEQRRGKWRGPLHGIPVALKDNIDTVGIRTTAASELFEDRVISEDAEVVRRLKEAGAVAHALRTRNRVAQKESRVNASLGILSALFATDMKLVRMPVLVEWSPLERRYRTRSVRRCAERSANPDNDATDPSAVG